jgi:hypothetical protein
MNIFDFRNVLIGDCASYMKSFIQIRDPQMNDFVQQKLEAGVLWPEPLIQLNPSPGGWLLENSEIELEHGSSVQNVLLQPFQIPQCFCKPL